jgi:hypothetical protein
MEANGCGRDTVVQSPRTVRLSRPVLPGGAGSWPRASVGRLAAKRVTHPSFDPVREAGARTESARLTPARSSLPSVTMRTRVAARSPEPAKYSSQLFHCRKRSGSPPRCLPLLLSHLTTECVVGGRGENSPKKISGLRPSTDRILGYARQSAAHPPLVQDDDDRVRRRLDVGTGVAFRWRQASVGTDRSHE